MTLLAGDGGGLREDAGVPPRVHPYARLDNVQGDDEGVGEGAGGPAAEGEEGVDDEGERALPQQGGGGQRPERRGDAVPAVDQNIKEVDVGRDEERLRRGSYAAWYLLGSRRAKSS